MKKFIKDLAKCCLLFLYSIFTPSAFLFLTPLGYVKHKPYFPNYISRLTDLVKWYIFGEGEMLHTQPRIHRQTLSYRQSYHEVRVR